MNIEDDIEFNFRQNQKYHLFNKDIILEIFKKHPDHNLTLRKIREYYQEKEPGFTFSISCLRKYLVKYHKSVYKVGNYKTYKGLTNKSYAQLSLFIKKILRIMKKNERIFFFDESKIATPKTHKKRWIIDLLT